MSQKKSFFFAFLLRKPFQKFKELKFFKFLFICFTYRPNRCFIYYMREKSRQHHKVCFSFYTSIQRHLAGWSFKPQTKKRAELCLLLNITTAAANFRIFFALRMYVPHCHAVNCQCFVNDFSSIHWPEWNKQTKNLIRRCMHTDGINF